MGDREVEEVVGAVIRRAEDRGVGAEWVEHVGAVIRRADDRGVGAVSLEEVATEGRSCTVSSEGSSTIPL